MDQSVETYIKMCDCPEIQSQRVEFRGGDVVYYVGTLLTDRRIDFIDSGGEPRRGGEVWMPSLEHLLDMGWDRPEPWQVIYPLHRWFNNRYDDYPSQFVSMKQLCLAFVMLKKFSKVWNWDSSGWVATTQGGA